MAFVNQTNDLDGSFASYAAPGVATTSVNAPITMSRFFGFFTAQTVQNVDTTAANVRITYGTGQTYTHTGLAPNATLVIDSKNLPGCVNTENTLCAPLPEGTATSAVIESTNGKKIVAVVNEGTHAKYVEDDLNTSVGPGDWLYSYTAFTR